MKERKMYVAVKRLKQDPTVPFMNQWDNPWREIGKSYNSRYKAAMDISKDPYYSNWIYEFGVKVILIKTEIIAVV